MKAINTIYKLSFLLALFIIMSACEEDGDKIYLSGLESSQLMATETDVVLTQEISGQQVLALAWTDNTLSVSDPKLGAPDVFSTYIQISTNSEFSSNVVEAQEASLSKVYTGLELNTVAKNLSAEPDIVTVFYFRLKGSVGNNIDPVYSNIVEVNVTPYLIDMSVGHILDSKMVSIGKKLSSPDLNGVYRGFMGVSGWYNFYLKEGDGTIWGNDGVDGSAFLLSSENDPDKRWNFWFPGFSGCYYTEINTVNKQWSAIYIPTLTVSGDIQGEMTFDRPNEKWTYVFNAASASTVNIKLNGAGKLYDYSTGTTDDTKAKDNPIAFAQNGDNIELAKQAGNISISIPEAGEVTLVVDLSDPNLWTCKVISGSVTPIEVSQFVYLPGIDDGITGGPWTFDNYLRLYNEEKLAYAGVANVNSLWGYQIQPEKDSWSNPYRLGEGDAYAGTLAINGASDLPKPVAGLYLIDVSLSELTYKLTPVTSDKVYISGLNDIWTFDVSLPATANPGEYKGSIAISKASEWGFKIYLEASWDELFGGSAGNLVYKGGGITDDKNLAPGTYQMTVNLIKGTYSITQ